MKKQSWWQLLAIQAGGTICPPIILIGGLLAQKYGWSQALLTIGLGNLVLLILGTLFASMSTFRPQSTVEHATRYFGPSGKWLFGSTLMFSVLGWFAIQLNVMSLSMGRFFTVPPFWINIGIGTVITGLMCFGMRTVKNLSYITVPLLLLALLYVALSSERAAPATSFVETWYAGIPLVIGAHIAAVIDLPTFLRHAQSPKEAKWCILLLYGMVVPSVEILGVFLSSLTEGNPIFDFFVLLSGWQTNNANLYSAITSSFTLWGNLSLPFRAAALGTVGVALACLNPLGNIEAVLEVMGMALGGMGIIIIANYLIERRSS